jgi:hypothetical protein
MTLYVIRLCPGFFMAVGKETKGAHSAVNTEVGLFERLAI